VKPKSSVFRKSADFDYTALPGFERKSVHAVGVKVLDEASGIVEAFVAGIGNLDDGGDIIEPTFFKSSLDKHLRKNPKGVWGHDWNVWVAKTLETRTVAPGSQELPTQLKAAGAGGQYVKMQFNLKTQAGRDAFENVVFFEDEAEWSIGYVATVATKDADGNRHLREGAWYEYSPVLFGMNPLTATVSAKDVKVNLEAATPKQIIEQVQRALEASKWETRIEALLDKGVVVEGIKLEKQMSEAALEGLCERFGDEDGFFTRCSEASIDVEDQDAFCAWLHHECHGTWPGEKCATCSPESKVYGMLTGTVEERLNAVTDALDSWVREEYPTGDGADPYDDSERVWAWAVGTYDDHVIACVTVDSANPAERRRYLDFPYSINDEGVAILGEPSEVEITANVQPKAMGVAALMLKVGRRHSSADEEMLNRIHDDAVKLGAYCPADEEEEKSYLAPSELMDLEMLVAAIG
jgi:hypothetical protein